MEISILNQRHHQDMIKKKKKKIQVTQSVCFQRPFGPRAQPKMRKKSNFNMHIFYLRDAFSLNSGNNYAAKTPTAASKFQSQTRSCNWKPIGKPLLVHDL